MDQISVLAAAGMQSRMQSLDLVANNLANSSSGGYKSDGEFYTLFASEAAGEDAVSLEPQPDGGDGFGARSEIERAEAPLSRKIGHAVLPLESSRARA